MEGELDRGRAAYAAHRWSDAFAALGAADEETALAPEDRRNEGAPAGARGLQFYPAADGSTVTCLWEPESVEGIQAYSDEVLGDAADTVCFEVDAEQAFCDRPLGLAPSPRAVA